MHDAPAGTACRGVGGGAGRAPEEISSRSRRVGCPGSRDGRRRRWHRRDGRGACPPRRCPARAVVTATEGGAEGADEGHGGSPRVRRGVSVADGPWIAGAPSVSTSPVLSRAGAWRHAFGDDKLSGSQEGCDLGIPRVARGEGRVTRKPWPSSSDPRGRPRGVRAAPGAEQPKERSWRRGSRLVVSSIAALPGIAAPVEPGKVVCGRGSLLARGLQRRAQRDASSRRPAQI